MTCHLNASNHSVQQYSREIDSTIGLAAHGRSSHVHPSKLFEIFGPQRVIWPKVDNSLISGELKKKNDPLPQSFADFKSWIYGWKSFMNAFAEDVKAVEFPVQLSSLYRCTICVANSFSPLTGVSDGRWLL